jgi:hypothetical protein
VNIFEWNDGPVDKLEYLKIHQRLVLVVDSPGMNRSSLFTQTEPLQIQSADFTWILSADELARWLSLIYDGSTIQLKSYPDPQDDFSDPTYDRNKHLDYLKTHLAKLNFIKLYGETIAPHFLSQSNALQNLKDPKLQSHLRQSIFEFRPSIIVYLGCAWAHNEIFYKNKWNLSNDLVNENYIKHHNETVYVGFSPKPMSYKENYCQLKSLLDLARQKLDKYQRGTA